MNEFQKLVFNGALFSITAISASIYGFAFNRHVRMGLTPDLWDKLILLCSIISTIFYALSLHSSYLLYRSRLSLGLDSPSLPHTIASFNSSPRNSNDGPQMSSIGLGISGAWMSRGNSPVRGAKADV